MFGCSPNVVLKSMRPTQEMIEQLETEEDLLSTLQASSNSSVANSSALYSKLFWKLSSHFRRKRTFAKSSLYTSEENEHSPKSSHLTSEENHEHSSKSSRHTSGERKHLPRSSCHTSEENEHPPESSRHNSEENEHSPETSVHILPSLEENKCGLEISQSSSLSSKLHLHFDVFRKQCWAVMHTCFGFMV